MLQKFVGREIEEMIQVLLVEDEEASAQEIRAHLETKFGAVVEEARSRDSALAILDGEQNFDLIVCDLRIPTTDGSVDVHEEHGLLVYDKARSKHSGTFSRFLSGYANLDNVGKQLSVGPIEDVFGTGDIWSLVECYQKSKLPEFFDWVERLNSALKDLDQIEISPLPKNPDEFQLRALRIYASRLSGTHIDTVALGGLSTARVFRVEILNSANVSVGLVVAKVDLLEKVQGELARYDSFVVPLRRVGTFAPLASKVLYGCGRFGAAFYSLAGNGYTDLFQLAATDVVKSQNAVTRLQEAHHVWKGNVVESHMSIGSVRSDRISDDDFARWRDELGGERVERLESLPLSLNRSIQHGDLHGRNVLVDATGSPLIIDYDDLGEHPVGLDPVTLEMSFVFHSDHPDLDGWPSVEQASQWFDLTEYARGSSLGEVITACRQWALSEATRKELAAVVYVHAVRQLKYSDTEKPLALAIARAAMAELLDRRRSTSSAMTN